MSRGAFATINFRTSSSDLSNALHISRGLRTNPSEQDNTIGEILRCSHDLLSAARIVGHIWQSTLISSACAWFVPVWHVLGAEPRST